jgi:hypothetical protein
MFFHRLAFDLTAAAVRRDYAIELFEPAVDRNGFDIVLDDADNERRFQVKSVLKSATTKKWETTKRLLLPDLRSGDRMGIEPAACGLGGGFIVIEIGDDNKQLDTEYLYTDYFIICALLMGFLVEARTSSTRIGRPAQARVTFAQQFLSEVRKGLPRDLIRIPKQLLLRVKSADALLAIAGFHSSLDYYLPGNQILDLYDRRFGVLSTGIADDGVSLETARVAQGYGEALLTLLKEPGLYLFDVSGSIDKLSRRNS